MLDVHLGTVARRLRLVGVDTAYASDAGDDALIEQANASRRVLLTQDRGLLSRRKPRLGADVRGYALTTSSGTCWTGSRRPLRHGPGARRATGTCPRPRRESVDPLLRPGTRRTCQAFSRCQSCGQVYWRGAHSKRLEQIIDSAARAVSNATGK